MRADKTAFARTLFALAMILALAFAAGGQESKTSTAQAGKTASNTKTTAAKPGAKSAPAQAAAKKNAAAKTTAKAAAAQSVAKGSAKPAAAKTAAKVTAPKAAAKAPAKAAARKAAPAKPQRRVSPWSEPTFADSTVADRLDGEDLTVRRAAVEALGRYNGSVVVVDPNTGRILTMVNQRTALTAAFLPCSTVKVPVAMAALSEGLIDRGTIFRVASGKRLSLTEALAHSDNPYFASLGQKLGFERVRYYASLMGLGEKAGWRIEGEQPGTLPSEPPPEGIGMMTSFGSGIAMTPLQLASLLSAFANGGTLYYLQYPRTNEELRDFVPRVKRFLNIEPWLSEIEPGMQAAVQYGTARRANFDRVDSLLGKTGTCTDRRTHLGWFGSYGEIGRQKLVVVVLLTGGAGVAGPVAAEIAGNTYRLLSQESFFANGGRLTTSSLTTLSCCAQ